MSTELQMLSALLAQEMADRELERARHEQELTDAGAAGASVSIEYAGALTAN
jgi:hypothetical protein